MMSNEVEGNPGEAHAQLVADRITRITKEVRR
jgi:hypothetical protein